MLGRSADDTTIKPGRDEATYTAPRERKQCVGADVSAVGVLASRETTVFFAT